MARGAAACGLVLAIGCNAILGNGNFKGPGAGDDDGGSDACTGIGCMVADCAGRGLPPTSLSGTVRAPDGVLPIYNALVYIPSAPLTPLGDGPASPACASGAPLVHTQTDVNGHFKLDNVPTVSNVPVVIQVGKWRRETTIPAVNECADLELLASETRLPRKSTEGHMPRIAVATGAAEALECFGFGIGVDFSEMTTSTGAGRIHLYAGAGSNATSEIGGAALEPVDRMYERMVQYDMLLFGCDGSALTKPPAAQQQMLQYVQSGGFVWLTHFQQTWLTDPPFPKLATFISAPTPMQMSVTARIDTSSPRGQAFADWMHGVGSSSQPGLMTLIGFRTTCTSVEPLAQQHIRLDPSVSSGLSAIELLSWQTPAGGRLYFSDIHLEDILTPPSPPPPFPFECSMTPLNPPQKAIMFQLFDQPTCLP
jgi:hypothetical protein